jgi:hypothetical protein
LNLEIFAYIKETDYDAFLVIQEELMLCVMDIVEANGTRLAPPAQIFYMDQHRSGKPANEADQATVGRQLYEDFPAGGGVDLHRPPERLNSHPTRPESR